MTTREVLVAAKARLTPERWGQGTATNGTVGLRQAGKECPMMALWEAVKTGRLYEPALHQYEPAMAALREVIKGLPDGDYGLIAAWNDNPRRTLTQVHAVFDAAIAAQEV